MFWIKKGIIYDEFHAQVPVVDTHHIRNRFDDSGFSYATLSN